MIKMKIVGLDHIHFIVKDLDESLEFYTKLGFTTEKGIPSHVDSIGLCISPGGVLFEIQAPRSTENPGHNHFALLVEDLDVAIEELKGEGIEVDGPIDAPTGRRIANFRDPSGFLWQLVDLKKK